MLQLLTMNQDFQEDLDWNAFQFEKELRKVNLNKNSDMIHNRDFSTGMYWFSPSTN